MITLGIIVIIVVSAFAVPVDGFLFWSSTPSVEVSKDNHLPLAEGARVYSEGGDSTPTRFHISRNRLLPPKLHDGAAFTTPLSANSAAVVDLASNEILFSKGIDDQRSIASITKLMSAMVVLDTAPDWKETIVISSDDMRVGREYVTQGERITISDLFHASLIGSSNSATTALARSTGLSQQEFVARMNQKAKVMGLVQTNFVEPTGLDPQNRSSAREIAVVLRHAMQYDEIADVTTMQQYPFAPVNTGLRRVVDSTNWLLTGQVVRLSDAVVRGGKTGFIDESGYNLAAQMSDGTHAVAVVVLGADDHFARFTEVDMLTAWVFENFSWIGDETYGNN